MLTNSNFDLKESGDSWLTKIITVIMATIKLKLRNSRVNVDEGVIFYQLYHCKQTIHITTNIRLSKSHFESLLKVKPIFDVEPFLRQIKFQIENDISILNSIIKDYESKFINYTVLDIKKSYTMGKNYVSFVTYMNNIIQKLQNIGKYGTAQNYRTTLHSFVNYLGVEDVSISCINSSLILDYNEWLESKNVTRNTISFYMRNLRAVFNRAVKDHLVEQTYPFVDVYTGVDKTRKLAITEDDLYKIVKLRIENDPALELARDIFLFSYSTRGMSFVDIAFLKKSNICNNIIVYKRKKTGQLLSVKVEPCIQTILSKYIDNDSILEFVFPILHSSSNELQNYKEYHIALTDYNRSLKKLAKLAEVQTHLSSYTARHTWATIAHYHNVPLPVISESMGHTSETTTKIYLASFQNTVIDQANSSLLEKLNVLISF